MSNGVPSVELASVSKRFGDLLAVDDIDRFVANRDHLADQLLGAPS